MIVSSSSQVLECYKGLWRGIMINDFSYTLIVSAEKFYLDIDSCPSTHIHAGQQRIHPGEQN